MSTAITKTASDSLLHFLASHREQIVTCLPRHMQPERVVELVVQQINRTPKLVDCKTRSVWNAIMTAGSLGLELRNGSAYLVPFGDECQLLIDYRGKLDLAMRSGKVKDLYSRVVYGRDKFEIRFGVERYLKHEPYLFDKDETGLMTAVADDSRGKPVLLYGMAYLTSGEPHFDTMTIAEVLKIKQQAIDRLVRQGRKVEASPWNAWEEQMWLKSMDHRLCKRIPQSPELNRAQEVDAHVLSGEPLDPIVDIEMDDEDKPMIEGGIGLMKLAMDYGVADQMPPKATHKDLEALLFRCPGCKTLMAKHKQEEHAAVCTVKPKARQTRVAAKHYDSFEDAPNSPESPEHKIYVGDKLFVAHPERSEWIEAQ